MKLPTEDKEALLTDEEIDDKFENDWDGYDQLSLARAVYQYALAKLERLGYKRE